jgi:rRNA maturation RNase YbeY
MSFKLNKKTLKKKSFDFYIDKLEDNIELAQHEQPKYKLEKVGSARYETVSATWNEKEYMPTHQIIKHYKIDEVSLKKVYNDSGEYWVDWFTSDDVDFMPYRFLLIGDLVICPEVVQREAREQNKSDAAHLAHQLVDGMLHLQGYDHEDDQSAEAMEALEVRILAQAGFSNPYALS